MGHEVSTDAFLHKLSLLLRGKFYASVRNLLVCNQPMCVGKVETKLHVLIFNTVRTYPHQDTDLCPVDISTTDFSYSHAVQHHMILHGSGVTAQLLLHWCYCMGPGAMRYLSKYGVL